MAHPRAIQLSVGRPVMSDNYRRLCWLIGLACASTISTGALAQEPRPATVPVPAADEFHFVVLGDSQFHDAAGFNRIVDDVRLLYPAFVIQVGDMIEGYTSDLTAVAGEWDRFRQQIAPLAPISFMPVPGNHDLYNASRQADPAIEQIYRETWGATYYSFSYRNSLMIILNTDPPGQEQTIDDGQWQWLRETLQQNSREHVFVFMHRPPDTLRNAEALHELLLAHRVRYVFYGHHHHYHFDERDGIRYVMTNAAANSSLTIDAVGGFDHFLQVSVRDSITSFAVIPADSIKTPAYVHPSDNYELFSIARELTPRRVVLTELPQVNGERRWQMPIKLNNPTDRELNLYIQCTSNDDRWLFNPHALAAIKLGAGESAEITLEASYLASRQPASSPRCEIQVPFQKRDGEWVDYAINIEAQVDR